MTRSKIENKLTQSKPTSSIFGQKSAVIEESPNEEDQASHEESDKKKNTADNILAKIPQATPASFTLVPPTKPVTSNPFLNQGGKSAHNLFNKEDKPLAPAEIKLDKSDDKPAPKVFSVGGTYPLFSKAVEAKVVPSRPSTLEQAHNFQEDDGMGGATPPNQSPIAASAPKSFVFDKKPKIDFFSTQSTEKTPSATPTASASIFGGHSVRGPSATVSQPGSIFSMGKSSTQPTKSIFGQSSSTSQSGSLFMSTPSQGQPDQNNKIAWSTSPFPGTKKEKVNDNLFSDK